MNVCDRYQRWVKSPSSTWPSWYIKSSLQGVVKTKLWIYFILAIIGCAGSSIWYKLIVQGPSVTDSEVLVALCAALPSLIGTTMLDYLLEEPSPRSVMWVALLVGVFSLVCVVCAYRFELMPPAYVAVIITLSISWAIKGRDSRFSCDNTGNSADGGSLDNAISGNIGEDKV